MSLYNKGFSKTLRAVSTSKGTALKRGKGNGGVIKILKIAVVEKW